MPTRANGGTGQPIGDRRSRRRLARTLSRARWDEYGRLLSEARARGYEIVALEEWLATAPASQRVLILRHDVDQHPRSVDPMLALETELGLKSTWYFRWRTADAATIHAVRAAGGDVGLHYETLTRRLLVNPAPVTPEVIAECRDELRREIEAFQRLFGPIRSVCPHGDSRVPGVTNQILLRDVDLREYDIEFDGNEAMRRHRLAVWLTDRNAPDGGWKDGVDPLALLAEGRSPILCLTHPNNLASGPGLWGDRLASALLPAPRPDVERRLRRTGRDAPPWNEADAPGSTFAPIADDLERSIRQFYARSGSSVLGASGQTTLLTNSHFTERRADTLLERLYERGGVRSLDGLDVLDVGCGFGALAVLFAHRGARVTAVDPNAQRFAVGREVAGRHGLPVEFRRGVAEALPVEPASFDLAVLNNSLCYIVPAERRKQALTQVARALRPGGWIVIRNPNRLYPLDQFTGLPAVHLLPPDAVTRLLDSAGVRRSQVRLQTPWAARRELLRIGYRDVSYSGGERSRLLRPFARYQHLVARAPAPGATVGPGG